MAGAVLAGLLAALDSRPDWAFDHAAAVAERCRELLAPRVELLTPEERATLVAFRPAGDAAELVAELYERGVHVREIPRTGLDPRLVRLVDVGRRPRPAGRRPAVSAPARCPCGAVRYSIDGPVRDVIVCHCDACQEATGGPWRLPPRTGAISDLADPTRPRAGRRRAVSEHDASRASCRDCGTNVLWDAPARETMSFACRTLDDASELVVARTSGSRRGGGCAALPAAPVEWHGVENEAGRG